jgi:hypothetical protein
VPSGLAASVESGIGGFSRGSAMICGCGGLRADLTGFFDGLLVSSFDGFSGGITGVVSGKSSANNPRPLGSFSDSTQRKKASFNSSIAAHPARPKLADKTVRPSATRPQASIGNRQPFKNVSPSMSGGFGGRVLGEVCYSLGVEG